MVVVLASEWDASRFNMLRPYQNFISLVLLLSVVAVKGITLPDSYDVTWTTQSRNSSESMPLGGGDIGLNVWSENSKSKHFSLAICLQHANI